MGETLITFSNWSFYEWLVLDVIALFWGGPVDFQFVAFGVRFSTINTLHFLDSFKAVFLIMIKKIRWFAKQYVSGMF